MKEVKIQKDKAIKRAKIMHISLFIIGTISWFFILNGFAFLIEMLEWLPNHQWHLSLLYYSIGFMLLWQGLLYKLDLMEINTLQYFIDEKNGRLLTSYKVIVKRKDTAKLQVINQIDLKQNLWDKFANLYKVEVTYGFSNEGYNFTFYYLSEKDAQKLLDEIKISEDIGVKLK